MTLYFLAVSPSTNGSLRLLTSHSTSSFQFFRNRAGHRPRDAVTILCHVGHVGDNIVRFTSPNAVWTKDGLPSTLLKLFPFSRYPAGNGDLESRLNFWATPPDAGVYQCIFTDTARSEVFLPHPIRLDMDIGEPSAMLPAHTCPAIFFYRRELYH